LRENAKARLTTMEPNTPPETTARRTSTRRN
jgi:hypothetical protein